MNQYTVPVDDWKAVIPTRNDHPELLRNLVTVLGPGNTVVVHTATPDISPDIEGCINVRDYTELNIQAWWSTGITTAGTRYIALVNDDVTLAYNIVPVMVEACHANGKTLARLRGPEVPFNSGFLFVIDTSHGLRPDTGFQWWWGDDDLYRQAEHAHGIIEIPSAGVHHPDDKAYHLNPKFAPLIAADKERYRQKWYPLENWG